MMLEFKSPFTSGLSKSSTMLRSSTPTICSEEEDGSLSPPESPPPMTPKSQVRFYRSRLLLPKKFKAKSAKYANPHHLHHQRSTSGTNKCSSTLNRVWGSLVAAGWARSPSIKNQSRIKQERFSRCNSIEDSKESTVAAKIFDDSECDSLDGTTTSGCNIIAICLSLFKRVFVYTFFVYK